MTKLLIARKISQTTFFIPPLMHTKTLKFSQRFSCKNYRFLLFFMPKCAQYGPMTQTQAFHPAKPPET
jgi:hypothetical protein